MTPTKNNVEPTTSATERLRALLDERGVEWWEEDGHTLWYGESIHHAASAFSSFMFGENERVHLCAMVTPKQAVAATLGPGTCVVVSSILHEYEGGYAGSEWEHELSCGHTVWWSSGDTPEWCPWCGRKVVDL